MNTQKRYQGIDFSSTWKVVSYEGKTLTTTFRDEEGRVVIRPLRGYSKYQEVAKLAKEFGGVAIRE